MAELNPKKGNSKKQRESADKILLEFLTKNKLVIVVDEIDQLQTDIKDVLYSNTKKPRIRVFYEDQVKQQETPKIQTVN